MVPFQAVTAELLTSTVPPAGGEVTIRGAVIVRLDLIAYCLLGDRDTPPGHAVFAVLKTDVSSVDPLAAGENSSIEHATGTLTIQEDTRASVPFQTDVIIVWALA